MAENPLLSIVITSYTTERIKDIYELLDSIKMQTYQRIETILVVERSEGLHELIKCYIGEKAIPNVRLFFNDGELGASAARNLGIQRAQGEIIAFIDDDAFPFPDWAEETVKTFQDDSVVGVTGPALPLWEDNEKMSWFPKEFYWIVGSTEWDNRQQITEVRNMWTMNASCRKEALNTAGLFLTSIGPRGGSMAGRKNDISEDVELSLRIKEKTGGRIVYNPKVKVQHKVYKDRIKLGFIARWSYWMGLSKYKLKKLSPKKNGTNNILEQENQLLKRIITRFFPGVVKEFFKHPIIALRKSAVALTSLLFIAIGYFFAFLSRR